VGGSDGANVGAGDGGAVRRGVGGSDGTAVGLTVGTAVGDADGAADGAAVVGVRDGAAVGSVVGLQLLGSFHTRQCSSACGWVGGWSVWVGGVCVCVPRHLIHYSARHVCARTFVSEMELGMHSAMELEPAWG
jgi:hypothetical protein